MSIIRKGRRKVAKKKILFICSILLVVLVSFICFIVNYSRIFPMKEVIIIPSYQGAVIIRDIAKGENIQEQDLNLITLSGKYDDLNILSKEEAIGSKLKYDLHANTVLSRDMLETDQVIENDIRKHVYHFIEITDQLSHDDYVDIRIQFPNGADYIVLSKKRVLGCSLYDEVKKTDNCLWLAVSEKEILRLSSAVIDAYYDERVKIYAIQYVSHEQVGAVVTYPENDVVHALMQEDPNIIDQAEQTVSDRVRERVTMRLKEYRDQSTYDQANQEYNTQIFFENDNDQDNNASKEQESVYIDQNSIPSRGECDQESLNFTD